MATLNPTDPEFLKLRKEWYAKAKESGFKDIENINWENGESRECLNGMTQGDMVRRWTPHKQRYYELAAQFNWVLDCRVWMVEGYKEPWKRWKGRHPALLGLPPRISRALAARIWAEHAQGYGYKTIAQKVSCSVWTAEIVVKHLQAIMLAHA